MAKRTPKQVAAQLLADVQRRNANLLRQLQDAQAQTERLSEAAESEVCISVVWSLYTVPAVMLSVVS